MKTPWTIFSALFIAGLLLTGCANDDTDAASSTGEPAEEPVTSITITGNDRMQFDITRFVVPAGEEITLTFKNIGRMPKESMGHNLAIIDQSLSANAFSAASQRHPNNEYIAPEHEDKVIAATRILGPGEEETIVFTAPTEPGEYPFVCSFPAHTPAGMRGIMVVQ